MSPPGQKAFSMLNWERVEGNYNSSRGKEEAGPKQKWCSIVNVSGGESKVPCSIKQFCIGTWDVRFLNQGKLDVVKQKMARVNIDILGISELKLTGPGEFNSDDHYIYYCGQESLRRNGGGLVANKRVQNAALGCSLINGRMIYLCFQGQSFNITLILVYAPNTTAKDAEVDQFYEDLQDLLYLTLKKKRQGKDFLFIIKNWNAKGGITRYPE